MKKQCPHCYETIEAFVMQRWDMSSNSKRNFEMSCPICFKAIVVEVTLEPIFNFRKAS